MNHKTPFFPALRYLCGRPSQSQAQLLARQFKHIRECSLSQLESLFEGIIPHTLLTKAREGANSRERIFGPRVTFWAFLGQVLRRERCRGAVRLVQARRQMLGQAEISADTSAYCRARLRLCMKILQGIGERVVAYLRRLCPPGNLWKGREVLVVDGTSASMADTPANQLEFPQSGGQKRGCGFPVVQLVGLFCLASGALTKFARTEIKVHELAVFVLELLEELKRGQILLGDRAFGTYACLALLIERGVDGVFRLHQARRVVGAEIKIIGLEDRRVRWSKSKQRPVYLGAEEYDQLPPTLLLRQIRFRIEQPGFRSQEIVLITTLLDEEAYTAEDLMELYLRRWAVELSFRDIKTTLGMDILGGQSPAIVEREITMHLIGYNLLRTLMLEASISHQTPLHRLSFKGSLDTVRHWSEVIDRVRDKPRLRQQAIDEMLFIIASDRLAHRPHRSEPRAVKRRPKGYQLMNRPRNEMEISPSRKLK